MAKSYPYIQIRSISELPSPEAETGLIGHYAFQYIDFTEAADYALSHSFVDCCFFGCQLCPGQYSLLRDCLVLPRMGMSYHAFNPDLYTPESLYEGFRIGDSSSFGRCYDQRVYKEFTESSENDLRNTLAQALHDHSIFDAMNDFIQRYKPQNVIGIMGGHGISRNDEGYRKIVHISKKLTEAGKLMTSGGGPGAMEATHLGAWMAGRSEEELEDALEMLGGLSIEDRYAWLDSAFRVRMKYPQTDYCSLSIPTWLYGHEPSTPFATHIAKFFTNSVREDMILSTALGGIIFTPGSAGTMQEIFQNASKLHYDSDGIVGPMIFLGTEFFSSTVPVYPFLKELVDKGKYINLHLSLTDDTQEVISTLM